MMKKWLINSILLSVLIGWMSSCTEVINIDLNEAEPQIVVEAHIPESGVAQVKLTWSVAFDAENIFPPVTGAKVWISEKDGAEELLYEYRPGHYRGANLIGAIGETYQLRITYQDQLLEAEDKMPVPVGMDTLIVRDFVGFVGPVPGLLEVVAVYTDPADEENFYRFIEYKNDTIVNYYLNEDRFNNGKTIANSLFNFRRALSPGDVLTVEMQSVSKPVYEYLFGFSGANGGPQAASPANPKTNIRGAKLGYFSAHTVQRISIIISE